MSTFEVILCFRVGSIAKTQCMVQLQAVPAFWWILLMNLPATISSVQVPVLSHKNVVASEASSSRLVYYNKWKLRSSICVNFQLKERAPLELRRQNRYWCDCNSPAEGGQMVSDSFGGGLGLQGLECAFSITFKTPAFFTWGLSIVEFMSIL